MCPLAYESNDETVLEGGGESAPGAKFCCMAKGDAPAGTLDAAEYVDDLTCIGGTRPISDGGRESILFPYCGLSVYGVPGPLLMAKGVISAAMEKRSPSPGTGPRTPPNPNSLLVSTAVYLPGRCALAFRRLMQKHKPMAATTMATTPPTMTATIVVVEDDDLLEELLFEDEV